MDLSRRFNHSRWYRTLITPFEVLRYYFRLKTDRAKFVTEREWKAQKQIKSICGYCSEVLPQDMGGRSYQIWGQARYIPYPLPVKVEESSRDDLVLAYHASHHFHFPAVCPHCGTRFYNAYATKLLKILVLIFY